MRFLPPRTGGRFKVPRWALRHPLYRERLAEAAEAIYDAQLPPLEALAQLAHVVRATVSEVRRCRGGASPKAFAWQANWLAAARSCWERRDAQGLDRALEECPSHRGLFCDETGGVRHDIQDEDVAREIRARCYAQAVAEMNEDLAIRSRSARMLSAFSAKHRRIESMAAPDPDSGEVYSDPGRVGHLLAHHWGPVFATAPSPSPTSMRPFLDVCPRLSGDEVFESLSFDEFSEVIRHNKASSPGPDGLPYEVWVFGGRFGPLLIYTLYCYIIGGGEVPSDFNASLLLCLALRRRWLEGWSTGMLWPTRVDSDRSLFKQHTA